MRYKIINKKKKILVTIADLLGYAVWTPLKLFRKSHSISPDSVREILVIRTAYIGDVVLTLPVLKPLREMYPKARITFLTSCSASAVFTNNPYVDEVLSYDAFWFYPTKLGKAIGEYRKFLKVLRARRYDLVLECRGDIRDILLLSYLSKSRRRVSYNIGGGGYLLSDVVPYESLKHKVEYHLDIVRHLGGETGELEWDMYVNEQEQSAAEKLLSDKGVGQAGLLVGIHPGARMPLKCWSKDKFAEIADRMIDRYEAQIVFTGSQADRELTDGIITRMKGTAVNLAGETNLRILAGVMNKLSLFVCEDTATVHIASAMKTPTVAIFGPSKSIETGPYGNIHRVVEKDFPCRFGCDEGSCGRQVSQECMKAVEVEDVWTAAEEVLAQAGERSGH